MHWLSWRRHASPTIADKDGVTPLQHARKRGHAEIVRIIRDAQG